MVVLRRRYRGGFNVCFGLGGEELESEILPGSTNSNPVLGGEVTPPI